MLVTEPHIGSFGTDVLLSHGGHLMSSTCRGSCICSGPPVLWPESGCGPDEVHAGCQGGLSAQCDIRTLVIL